MSRDSRPSDQVAEELRDLDAGLQLERPKVDWAKTVSARQSRRRTVNLAVGSLIVLCLALPAAWYASQPRTNGTTGGTIAKGPDANLKTSVESRQELLAIDREISEINRSIVSMKRSQRRTLAEKVAKRAKPKVNHFSDPIEEGALVILAAAEKAERADKKDASVALYRRLVELFPETRSADIARRQLM